MVEFRNWEESTYKRKLAYKTIMRRVASLAGLHRFYQGIGIIKHIPFMSVSVGHYSRSLELNEVSDVYEAIQQLKNEDFCLQIQQYLIK